VNSIGTDPLNADTDDDGLNDGLEVDAGTDPLDWDSDDDGIPDGQDVEFLEMLLDDLSEEGFRGMGGGTLVSLNGLLDAIERHVAAGRTERALAAIERLRGHMDGCGDEPDGDDWLRDCDEQVRIRGYVDLLSANLAP
jgi:hypothetical protein